MQPMQPTQLVEPVICDEAPAASSTPPATQQTSMQQTSMQQTSMQQTAMQQTATRRRRPAPRGMSLLEIMVVITLIGLVTAAIGVAVMGQLGEGQRKTASNQAYEIAKSLELYKLNAGRYPSTAEALQVLVNPPKGKPLMDSLPKDPWGADYIYTMPGQKNPNKFDVRSKGPDGQEGTEDDIGNWPVE